jgi:hypothetical protein
MFKLVDFGQFKRKIMIYSDLTKEAMKLHIMLIKNRLIKLGYPTFFMASIISLKIERITKKLILIYMAKSHRTTCTIHP